MKIVVDIIICLITCILYIHVYNHLYTSNDLTVHYIADYNKTALDDLVGLKTPFYFNIQQFITDPHPIIDNDYPCIRDDTLQTITYSAGLSLCQKEKKNIHISGKGTTSDTHLSIDTHPHIDDFIKPYVYHTMDHSFYYGSENANTPLQYSIHCRNFIYTKTPLDVILIPPKCNPHLKIQKDYKNMTYKSPLNVWDPQPQYKYIMKDLKILKLTVPAHHVLFIPAYWCYSTRFITPNSTYFLYSYKTLMNKVATLPHYIMNFFQTHNTSITIQYDELQK